MKSIKVFIITILFVNVQFAFTQATIYGVSFTNLRGNDIDSTFYKFRFGASNIGLQINSRFNEGYSQMTTEFGYSVIGAKQKLFDHTNDIKVYGIHIGVFYKFMILPDAATIPYVKLGPDFMFLFANYPNIKIKDEDEGDFNHRVYNIPLSVGIGCSLFDQLVDIELRKYYGMTSLLGSQKVYDRHVAFNIIISWDR